MTDIWGMFPYPTLAEGKFTDGSILDTHPDCRTCPTKECASSTAGEGVPRVCRFGLTFARIDDQRVTLGLVASDLATPSGRARKRFRNESHRRTKQADIEKAIFSAIAMGPGVVENLARSKQEVLARLSKDPEMHRQLAEDLRQGFDKNFQQSHDFQQLVTLIKGHAEALLRERMPNTDLHTAADTLPIEGAIYYSTSLMSVKLDSLKFLNEVNMALGNEQVFKLHPFVLKYVRIYNHQASQKNLQVSVTGDCYSNVRYNSDAVGAIVQGLLDNLVKYAPAGSSANVHFSESEGDVTVSFRSLGPLIEEGERAKIFLAGVRSKAAKDEVNTGQGIGLAAAKQVADALDIGLEVEQGTVEDERYARRYLTRFHVRLSTQR